MCPCFYSCKYCPVLLSDASPPQKKNCSSELKLFFFQFLVQLYSTANLIYAQLDHVLDLIEEGTAGIQRWIHVMFFTEILDSKISPKDSMDLSTVDQCMLFKKYRYQQYI